MLFATAICILGAFWYQFATYVHPDIGWLLHVARAVSEGSTLYTDLIEINPPLAVWLLYPIVRIAEATGGSLEMVFSLAIGTIALGIIACSVWLLEPQERWPAIPLLAFVSFVAPHRDFGQREYLLMVSLFPYLGLVARRVRGGTIGTGAAVLVGLTAAAGLALKPHFGAIWLGLGVYLAYHLGVRRFLRLPETVTAVIAAPVYLLAVTLFTPHYWTVVRNLGPLYLDYRSFQASVLLLQPPAMVALLAIGLWAIARWRTNRRVLQDVLAIAAAGAVLGMLAQGKGFFYHYLPVLGLGILLAVSMLGQWRPLTLTVGLLIALSGQILYEWYSVEWQLLNRWTSPTARIEARITPAIKPGDRISFLSWHLRDAWPAALRLGSAYTYPMPSIWWLQALYPVPAAESKHVEFRAPDEMDATERFLFDMTVHDLVDNQPRIIVMPRGTGAHATHEIPTGEYDVAKYFSQDDRVRNLLTMYSFESTLGYLAIWRRVETLDSSVPASQVIHRP